MLLEILLSSFFNLLIYFHSISKAGYDREIRRDCPPIHWTKNERHKFSLTVEMLIFHVRVLALIMHVSCLVLVSCYCGLQETTLICQGLRFLAPSARSSHAFEERTKKIKRELSFSLHFSFCVLLKGTIKKWNWTTI